MKRFYLALLASIICLYGYGQSSELVFLKLNLNNGSNFYNTDIYFNDNATLGFDFGYDAQFFGEVPAFAIYSLLVEGNVGDEYVLQAVNTNNLADVTIPIGVNANQGQSITFQIANSTLPETTEVYLDDIELGTSTLLNASNYVITTTSNLSGTGRFFLRFFDETLSGPYIFDGVWSPSDPSGITTINNDLIVLSGNAELTTATTVNAITIEPGASLTVLNGELSATSINLKSTSTTYSSLIRSGSSNINAAEITYERYINANSGGNDLVSAPVMGQSWLDFLGDNASVLLNDGSTSGVIQYAFAPFDKSTGDFENLNNESDYVLTPGTGFRAATSLGETVLFTGVFPTSDTPIAVDIRNEGPDYAEWNLIGNPYPSYLSIEDFFNHETPEGLRNITLLNSESAGVYAYNGNGYDIINLSNVSARPLMAPGQGFFVSANESLVDSFDIEFTIAMQSSGNSDDFITGRNDTLKYVFLEMSTASNQSKTELYFNDNASNGFDVGYDAKLWGDIIPEFSLYSHLAEENLGIPIALQTLHSSQIANSTIPLGVHANQGEEITFSLIETALPESINIYLEDTLTNSLTLLNNSNYVVTPSSDLSGTGRFFLRVSESALSVTDTNFDTLNIYSQNNLEEIVISGILQNKTQVDIIDIQGRVMMSKDLDNSLIENRIDATSLSSGVYIVIVQDKTQRISKKVIIN